MSSYDRSFYLFVYPDNIDKVKNRLNKFNSKFNGILIPDEEGYINTVHNVEELNNLDFNIDDISLEYFFENQDDELEADFDEELNKLMDEELVHSYSS